MSAVLWMQHLSWTPNFRASDNGTGGISMTRGSRSVITGLRFSTHTQLPPPSCVSYAFVQATVGIGTVIIVYAI